MTAEPTETSWQTLHSANDVHASPSTAPAPLDVLPPPPELIVRWRPLGIDLPAKDAQEQPESNTPDFLRRQLDD